jgi:hypothetical protein
MIRKIRRMRQLVPTKFATVYGDVERGNVPVFCTWWMWFGRSFKVEREDIAFG